jgi:hypothetical protein
MHMKSYIKQEFMHSNTHAHKHTILIKVLFYPNSSINLVLICFTKSRVLQTFPPWVGWGLGDTCEAVRRGKHSGIQTALGVALVCRTFLRGVPRSSMGQYSGAQACL